MTLESLSNPTPVAPGSAPPLGLIVFGRDENQRPHASCFDPNEAEAAVRAAELMGLHTLPVEDAAQQDLAAGLPKGRIFAASGKAFVPFCKAAVFEQLLASAGHVEPPRPRKAAGKAAGGVRAPEGGEGGAGQPDRPGGPDLPGDWAGIGIGSLVLATEGPMEGWYEAVIEYTKADDSFTLRWRDFPLEPTIVRSRDQLGLLPPSGNLGYRA